MHLKLSELITCYSKVRVTGDAFCTPNLKLTHDASCLSDSIGHILFVWHISHIKSNLVIYGQLPHAYLQNYDIIIIMNRKHKLKSISH